MLRPGRRSGPCPAGQHAAPGNGHAGKTVPALVLGVTLTVAAAACGPGSGSAPTSAPVSHTSAPVSSSGLMRLPGAGSLPAQRSQTLPAFPAYYDAHKDIVVVSDAFPKAAAGTFHANYAPSLSVVHPASQPAWYIIRGRAAAGQLAVLGSEPGESDYSPLWRTVIVRWRSGTTPKVLTSDNMILGMVKRGQLTITKTAVIVNAPVISKP